MPSLTPAALALVALFCGGWLAAALWATLRGVARSRAAVAQTREVARLEALLAASPALPLIARRDGSLQGPSATAQMLGLEALPATLQGLTASLPEAELDALSSAVAACAASGAPFTLELRPMRSVRVVELRGGAAPHPWAEGDVLAWLQDATDTADRLAASEQRAQRLSGALDSLSGLIEAAPFPMWHRGPDLRLAMVNSAYVEAVEADDAGAVVADGIELIDEPEAAAAHAAAARDSGAPQFRTVPATVAGERRTMQVVEVPIGSAGVAGYAVDVEDREQARADLERFVRAQRDMLDRLSAGVAQFGRDRSLIFFNQPFARIFSLKSDFLADRPEFNRLLDAMRDAGHMPEVRDYPDWKRDHGRWFTGGLAAEEEDWLLPGGRHLRVVAQPLPDGGLLLIFEDRTEQLRLASARDTLLRVRTATFDNLFEAVGVFASDGRLHLWNNRFRQLWEFEEEQLTGNPRIDTLTPHIGRKLRNPQHAGLVRELVRSATVERKQRGGRVAFVDGREFEFAAVPLPDGNALFTMLDVTASRTVEAALRERTAALEEADRLKTAFVSNMSYELRTPLTSIAGFAEMLEAGYAGELPPPATDYVSAILQSVARLGALIDDVLDLTQSDSGSLLLAEEKIALEPFCREAAAAFQAQAEAKGIAFVVETGSGLGSITGDRRRLRQSLDNILKNAVTFTDPGGRILLHAAGTRAAAEIIVSDNGHGIAPAEQARVFDRFHRSREGGDAALGLGLPLARQFVEAHGGTVELVSEPGQGTTVTVRLPRKKG
ncbi:MAG: PAS-domain containing protein [Alphaproteobacteria bacterium]|nr:PAS-domain containing protein [Alphaproteobacteria bacterium]MBV9371240.1 PAS-domain containing protein [Alphaproteobacteria bacterium]MBV9902821.1 PAS-domain containing protein [Alphaproteobacteria bacterium]